MADSVTRKGIRLFIDGREVENSLKTIRNELAHATNALAKVKYGTEEWNKAAQKQAQIKAIYQEHIAAQKEIEKQYLKMGDASDEYNKKKEKAFSMSNLANGFNKYFGLITSFLAGLTGLSLTFRKLAEDVAHMDDVYADVMKTTGMAKEEVKEMNKEFKKIDTRTSREELNKIAEEGGRIGIAKYQILEFTKAMDVANVALGDSFDGGVEEISNTLGKLKFLFSETKDMGVESAYLSIASAINELGANGTASEKNIAEFTTRLGSLSENLKPTIADALGLGAAFEESGIEAQIASRAYSIVLNRASTKTAEFAKVMGKSKEEVENLINTNPTEFFLQFSESLKGLSAVDAARTLNELKINADGANKIVGAAANNTERFREILEMANKSFIDGTSVINEFNIKNNTLAAQLDKAKKSFKETALELGERLNPILLKSVNGTTYLIKGLSSLLNWASQNKGMLTTLAVVLGIYTAAVNGSRIALAFKAGWLKIVTTALGSQRAATLAGSAVINLFSGNLDKARKAMVLLTATMKVNPFILIGTAIAGLTAWIYKLATATKRVAVEANTLNDVRTEAKKRIVDESAEIDRLIKIARDETISKDNRLAAIKKLNEISPEYLGNLNLETIDTIEAKKAVDAYKTSLFQAALAAASFDKIKELQRKNIDLGALSDKDILNDNLNWLQKTKLNVWSFFGAADEKDVAAKWRAAIKEENDREIIRLQKINEAASKNSPITNEDVVIPPNIPGGDGSGDILKEQLKAIEKQAAIRRIAAMQTYKDQKSFEEELLKIEKETIEAKMVLYKEGSDEYVKLQEDLAKIDLKATQDREKAEKDRQEKIKNLIEKYNKEAAVTDEQKKQKELEYLDSLFSEELRKTKEYLELQQAIINKYDPIHKKNVEKANQLVSDNPEATSKKKDLKTQLRDDDLSSNKKSKMIDSAENAELSQLDALQALHDGEIDSIIDYEDMRLRITQKYSDLRKEVEEEEFNRKVQLAQFAIDQISTLLSAYSSYVQASEDAEVAAIEAKYDKQIKAAGKNQKKVEKLEKEKEEEAAKVRAKYEEKSFKIQIAQALASTAMGAINAFSSAAAIPVVGTVLAPIAAGVAFAAGMLQVAAIKKQHEAAKENYYTGGFTPTGEWDKPQGVVHSDEFVANRFATGNPMLRPVFDVIDYAQRNNTINSLGKKDIARALGMKGFAEGGYVNQTVVNNNSRAIDTSYIEALLQVIDRLNKKLDDPFVGEVSITGRHGIKENMDLYNEMIENVSR